MKKPLVSIIVPTKNSSEFLGQCLQSIKNQTYKNIELIVVDNNSTDNTKEIARKYTKLLFNKGPERSSQKNYGIKKSEGKYLFFIDSDMELTPTIIKDCVEIIVSSKKIGGVVIPERSIGNSFWVKVRDFERSFYAGTEIESARFFRKDLVKKVSGFDENIIFFEESILPQKIEKLGYNVKTRISSEISHHEDDFSLLNWLKKKYYYGKTANPYIKNHKTISHNQTSLLFRYSLFFKNVRFFKNPILALGTLFLKAMEFLFAGIGYLRGKIEK